MADRRLRGSVRLRITVLATVVVAVVLSVMAVALVVTQRNGLVDQLDDALDVDAERIAIALESGADLSLSDDDDRLVVAAVDGAIVAVTPDLDGDEAAQLTELLLRDDGDASIDGERHRMARADEGRATVVVAASTEDIDETVASLVRTLMLLVPAASLLLAVTVWILVGRTLRPVDRIRAEVDEIGLDELDRRVPQPDGDDEIARLAATMNQMLGRLETANDRQRQFVADAAHELRTPLTRLRTDLEVGIAFPEDGLGDRPVDQGDDGAARQRGLLDDVVALQHLVDDLLLLARTDENSSRIAAPVDLDDLALDEARAVGAIDVPIDVGRVSAAQVRGDASALRRVIRNLIDNASRHARSRVEVGLGEFDGSAVLTVDDDGPGVPPEHRAVIFERFRRLDEARTADGHSGLGLAIAREIVARHGGTIDVGDSALGGARFTVTIPVADRLTP